MFKPTPASVGGACPGRLSRTGEECPRGVPGAGERGERGEESESTSGTAVRCGTAGPGLFGG
jgi:hypothetical protein